MHSLHEVKVDISCMHGYVVSSWRRRRQASVHRLFRANVVTLPHIRTDTHCMENRAVELSLLTWTLKCLVLKVACLMSALRPHMQGFHEMLAIALNDLRLGLSIYATESYTHICITHAYAYMHTRNTDICICKSHSKRAQPQVFSCCCEHLTKALR